MDGNNPLDLISAVCSKLGSFVTGYRGWGCTDNREARHYSHMLTELLLLTISNVFFVPAVLLAFYRRHFLEGLVYLTTMSASVASIETVKKGL